MRLLLDENLPHRLRPLLVGHDASTTSFMGWSGKRIGELLALAAADGFEALLTADGNLPYQQHQLSLPIAVVLLKSPSNKLDDIRPLVPALLKALEDLPPSKVTLVS